MDPSGKSKGPPPAVKKVLSLFGSGREEDRMVGYLSFLKIGPKLLKFLPGMPFPCLVKIRLKLLIELPGHHSPMPCTFPQGAQTVLCEASCKSSNLSGLSSALLCWHALINLFWAQNMYCAFSAGGDTGCCAMQGRRRGTCATG